MKLSPPASSSDLDAAREVARRLNHIATPKEPARPLPPYAPLKEGGEGKLAPPRRPAPPAWEKAAMPAPAGIAPERVPPPVAAFAAAAPPPAPPPVVAAIVEPPAGGEAKVEESKSAAIVEAPEPAAPVAVEAPPMHAPSAAATPVAEPPPSVAAEPPPAPVEEVEALDEDMEPHETSASIEAAVSAPLTWPEVVANCLSLAEAKGTLVINPEGRVVAVAGDWPSPGAEAIAARLVPAMDKALKDAPTRSVSVPLGGLHLTAWRAPLVQGLVTVGFVADAPLRADLRPGIDATLKQGPEA